MRVKIIDYQFDADGNKLKLAPGGLNVAIDNTCYMSKAAVKKLNLVMEHSIGQVLNEAFILDKQDTLQTMIREMILTDEVSLTPVEGFSVVRADPYFARYD